MKASVSERRAQARCTAAHRATRLQGTCKPNAEVSDSLGSARLTAKPTARCPTSMVPALRFQLAVELQVDALERRRRVVRGARPSIVRLEARARGGAVGGRAGV